MSAYRTGDEEGLSDALLELVARRLHALADPTRIRLLTRLEREPATVRELTDELATTQQNVSKHLGLLYQTGIVTRLREGSRVRYTLNDYTVCRVVGQVTESVTAYAEELAQITGVEH